MQKLDLVMITKNSASQIGEKDFKKCLSSYSQLPIKEFFVIDNSRDNTSDIIKEFFPLAKIIKSSALRGKARQLGISQVKTSWFIFVDSDVELCSNWLTELKKYCTPKVAVISSRVKRTYEKNPRKNSAFSRALTHACLVQTSSVKDLVFPGDMNVLEDQFLKKHIEKKGLKWVIPEAPVSTHYQTKRFGADLKGCYEHGFMLGKYRLKPVGLQFFILLKAPFKPRIEGLGVLWHTIGMVKGILAR